MACDEGLVQRVREHLDERGDVHEKRMFGGVAFFVGGNMAAGVHKDCLIVRLSVEEAAKGLKKKHVGPFDITGRAMKGWVMIQPKGFEEDKDLHAWLDAGIAFAGSLPPKRATTKKAPARRTKKR